MENVTYTNGWGMGGEIGVLLADSNPLMLSALGEVIEQDPRLSLVSTANSAEAFLEVAARLPIGIGVIDWVLPVMGGERLLEILREQERAPKCVVYSSDQGAQIARRAMTAGAAGFCDRSAATDVLLDAIVKVHGGQMVFPFFDVRALRQDPIDTLTERERRLLAALAASGQSNKVLAAELGISVNTVKFHLRNLFEKLDVKTRSQAIALFYARGGPSGER